MNDAGTPGLPTVNPMMSDEVLIYMIKEHPALWDKNDRYYRDKMVKLKFWRKIAMHCCFNSVEDCKAKWKALREKYRRELVLEEKFLRTGNTQMARPNWYLMKSMAFIKDSMILRSLNSFDGSFLNMDEDAFNGDPTQEYIEIKSEPMMELTEDDRVLTTDSHSNDSSTIIDSEMQLQEEEIRPNQTSTDRKSNPNSGDSKYHHLDPRCLLASIPKKYSTPPSAPSNNIPNVNTTDLANFMKTISTAVTKIRNERMDDTDRKIAAFTSYLQEELKQLSQKDCDDLIDDIMCQVLSVKRRLRCEGLSEPRNSVESANSSPENEKTDEGVENELKDA